MGRKLYENEESFSGSNFWHLIKLIRWKGSLMKIIWLDLFVWLIIYYSINLSYRFLMEQEAKRRFEIVCTFCLRYGDSIPLTFVLGFYVSSIVGRWYQQYSSIPNPHSIFHKFSCYYINDSQDGLAFKKNFFRYMNLAFILHMRDICTPVRRRFPRLRALELEGLLTREERIILETSEESSAGLSTRVFVWAETMLHNARKCDYFLNITAFIDMICMVNDFRRGLLQISVLDATNLPLVYRQVVVIAVYSYLYSSILAHQYVHTPGLIDAKFPFFSIVQFLVYMGWLRTADIMMNPWGADDEDFDVISIIEGNIAFADRMLHVYPTEFPEAVSKSAVPRNDQKDLQPPDVAGSTSLADSHNSLRPNTDTTPLLPPNS